MFKMPERNDVKILQQRKKAKSTTTGVSNSKRSFKSDNQESSFSSSIPIQNRIKKSRGKYEPTLPKMRVTRNSQLQINSKGIQNNLEIPKNVAIHFGNYYGLHEGSLEKNFQNKTDTCPRDPQFSAYSHNKMQFTWQMIYKLESYAGKQNYAKEVSALLEGTVEPPNFKINLPPRENCIPNGKSQASFPLWYRDANKLLFSKNRDGRLNESYEKLTSYLSKNEGKIGRNDEKVLKKENEEDLESLKGESNSEEGSSRTQEKEAHGSTSLSESASCSESASNSNLTSGFSSVTGKSATGSTSTMESASDSEDEDEDEVEKGEDDSASSSLSRSLASADNESQGVNVPVVAH